MADSQDNINEKLDELLLEFFTKFEQLQSTKHGLATNMKNGFLFMSKARYSMGNKSVSSLQYGDRMKATVKISTTENCMAEVDEKGKENIGETKLFRICSENDYVDIQKNETKVEGSVRRRTHFNENDKEDLIHSEETEENKTEAKKKSLKNVNDPLRWFGVLVPHSLRQCQKEFKASCQLVCEVAQLEFELNEIIVGFNKLKEQKNMKDKNNTIKS